MENLRLILRQAINARFSGEQKELADRLAERVCASLESGNGSEGIQEAVATEIDSLLESAESALMDAERIIGGSGDGR